MGDSDAIHFREITPKDFYFAQILRIEERSYMELLDRLVLNPESLDSISYRHFNTVIEWANENLFEERVFAVEEWLELAFHLGKQKWDSSLDWLESQPITKVLTMIDILKNYAEERADQIKKAAKGR